MRKAAIPPTAGTGLVEAARSGDPRAQAALFDEYLPLVYNVIGRGLHGHPDVDDVVQETMLRALRALPRLREPERFRSWLVAIAVRQMHDHGRRQQASQARQSTLADTDDVPDTAADFAELAVDREALARAGGDLLEAGRWLSDDQRRTMALWWQETAGQLSRQEVADALELSVPHTAVRIQRMKARLQLAVGVLGAWRARPRCPELAALAQTPGARVLTKLGRHTDDCPRCLAAVSAWGTVDDMPIRLGGLAVPAGLAAGIPGLIAGHGATHGVLSGLWHSAGRMFTAKSAAATGAAVTVTAVAALAIHPYVVPQPHTPAASPPVERVAPPSSAVPSATPSKPTARTYSGLATADYYIAPDGSDTAPGTLNRPFATLTHAAAVARPGQTVAVRGGTYRPTNTITFKTTGTATKRVTISNYRDERPVFDGTRLPAGAGLLTQSGAYTTVRGLEIVRAPDIAYACGSCRGNVFARLDVHDNGRVGLLLSGAGTEDDQVVDSDFHDNHEPGTKGGYADGLLFRDGSGAGNRIRGCRSYDNSGDGVDVSGFDGAVTVDRTWSFGNGVNRWATADFSRGGSGFKVGGDVKSGGAQTVTNSAAWDNAGFGFTEVGSSGAPRLTGDTAYRNGAAGFAFVNSAAVLRRDLALANHPDSWLGAATWHIGNSWDGQGWTTEELELTGGAAAMGARGRDGSLPSTPFLSHSREPGLGARL